MLLQARNIAFTVSLFLLGVGVGAKAFSYKSATMSCLSTASALFFQLCYPDAAAASNIQILSPKPVGFENVSLVMVANNMAVLPFEWEIKDSIDQFYDIVLPASSNTTSPAIMSQYQIELDAAKVAEFIAFDEEFLGIIGKEATLEKVVSFEGEKCHEAPAFVPELHKLFFSDTSGPLYLLDTKTLELEEFQTTPYLHNVNGATYSNGTLYVTTNGGRTRGIFSLNLDTRVPTPIVNNYRGRHFNSPNDVIVDSLSNLWFTDPAYGYYSSWPFVSYPELPNAIYHFNTTSGALITVSTGVVNVPNGLTFSNDGTRLFVSDSVAFSGKPNPKSPKLDGMRNIHVFEIRGTRLENSRLVYAAEGMVPDGVRVTERGHLWAGTGEGVDVVDPESGRLLGKINTGSVVYNLCFEPGTGTAWLTAMDGIYRVRVKERSLR